MEILGAPFTSLTPSRTAQQLPCGSGPDVVVDGTVHQTQLTVSPAQVYAGDEVPATLCTGSSVTLSAGDHHVRVENSDVFTATRLTFVSPDYDPAPRPRCRGNARTPTRGRRRRPRGPACSPSGRTATRDGEQPRTVPTSPPSASTAGSRAGARPGRERSGRRDLRPERLYRAGLVAGAVSLLALLALVLLWLRRPPEARCSGRHPRGARMVVGRCRALSFGVIAGWPGAGLAVAAAVVVRRWRGPEDTWRGQPASRSCSPPPTTRSTGGVPRRLGRRRLLPQLAVLLALVLAVSSAGRPSPRSRIAGTSRSGRAARPAAG